MHLFKCFGNLWSKITKCLELVFKFQIPKDASLLLFSDGFNLRDNTCLFARKIVFAVLTAANKDIIHSWFSNPPTITEWFNHFRDVCLIER